MATIGNTVLTFADIAKRVDSSGKTSHIVEMLGQSNPIIDDLLVKECNDGTGELTTVRTGLPAVYWRSANAGVPTSASKTAQVRETTGVMEAYSEIDVLVARRSGDARRSRLSEATAFLEAMSQEAASTLFYGNAGVSPEEFSGLSIRYSTVNTATAPIAANVIDAGGTGSDNCSIWLLGVGEQTLHAIYPQGEMAGLQHQDLGEVTIESAGGIGNGTRMQAYRDHWSWHLGITVKDWRFNVRIANIDVSNLVGISSAADLTNFMIKATHRIPYPGMAKFYWYMNRTCFQMLDIQRRDDVVAGGGLTYENIDGKRVPTFRTYPIRVCDALLENEARVV